MEFGGRGERDWECKEPIVSGKLVFVGGVPRDLLIAAVVWTWSM